MDRMKRIYKVVRGQERLRVKQLDDRETIKWPDSSGHFQEVLSFFLPIIWNRRISVKNNGFGAMRPIAC